MYQKQYLRKQDTDLSPVPTKITRCNIFFAKKLLVSKIIPIFALSL